LINSIWKGVFYAFRRDVLKEFIFDCEVRKISPRTLKGYKNNNLKFFNFIEKDYKITELEEISHLHIKKYFQFLIEKGLSEVYVNGILKCMRAFFAYCTKEEYVAKNSCLKVSWQKEPKVLINTFTDKEIKDMVSTFDHSNYLNARNKCIIAFLVDTGARNLETCRLLNSSIKDSYITIFGKGNKERHVGLSPELRKIMIKYERIRNFYFKDKT
jgi:integrase/recombinase XerD